MVESNPRLEYFQGKSPYLHSTIPFCLKDDDVWKFVNVLVNPKGVQSFTIEFGWSRHLRVPETDASIFIDSEPRLDRYSQMAYMNRISVFLGGKDTWSYLEDPANITGHFAKRDISEKEADTKVWEQLLVAKDPVLKGVLPYLDALPVLGK